MSKVAHRIQEKARTGDVQISESVEFSGLLLSDNVLNGLKNSGFIRPSPIQLKAIPLGRCGLDLIVQAKSGTGKTCVFSVIALESIATDTASTQVLVLAPTREIAIQIWEVINSIGSATKDLECHTFIGGLPLHEDRIKLKKCHIAVGTPGRIKQLIEGGVLRTDSLRLFILDEADKLLEESFQEQINWIYSTLPDNKQMLALSATYPEYLADHLTAYMRNPTFLRLNISDPALLGIRQYYTSVAYHPLSHVVFEEKCKVLNNILSSVSFQQCLVFSNLQTRAQTLADTLTSQGWPTACIAGCLDQRDRNHAMARLKTYKCRILISTDLTSRGIDADKVNMVINLDVPKDHETYLHRIGRAGRFGSFGIAVTLVSDGQEKLSLDLVEKQCNTQIYPLPDPLPSDLAKPGSPISLDDVVSAEVINTENTYSNQRSPVKEKLSSISKSFNESKNVRPTENTSSNEDDVSSNNKGVKDSLHDVEYKNGGNVIDIAEESDMCQDKVGIFDNIQTIEARTAVNYEDLEYMDMDEKLHIDTKREVDPKYRNCIDSVTGGKNKKSISGNSNGCKTDKADGEGKEKEKSTVASNTSINGDMSQKSESSLLNDRGDSLKKSNSSVSQAEILSEADSYAQDNNTIKTVPNRTLPDKEVHVYHLHSFSDSKLSASSFEKVNICNVFKNSTGYKTLSKPHSYNSARESLKTFRGKFENGVESIDTKEYCTVPNLKNENAESGTLQCAISEIQDMVDKRLYAKTSDATKVEVESEDLTTVDSISSEDEFEAKEDILNEGNRAAASLKVEVENKSEDYADEQKATNPVENMVDKGFEKPKEKIRKSIQKPKTRFGYHGNFAIGHLLQQERTQKLKTENILKEGTSIGPRDPSNENDALKDDSEIFEIIGNDIKQISLNTGMNTDDQNSHKDKIQAEFIKSSFKNDERIREKCTFLTSRELDDNKEECMREKELSTNNDINLEIGSDSVSSTTDSESTDRDLGAIPKMYTRTRKSPESRSRHIERDQRNRDHRNCDTKSEDSGVYSRPSYKERWEKWCKQYEEWHEQVMNIWGYQGMLENQAQDLTDGINCQSHESMPSWHYPPQSMYYPYQNYHHPSYHQNYHQNYPYDYSMYHMNSYWYPNQNSSKLNEQMGDAFQFQEEYIKEMSKCKK